MNHATHPGAADEVAHVIGGTGRQAITLRADASRKYEAERMFADAGLQRDPAFTEMTMERR